MDKENNNLSRLLKSSLAVEENKALRQEFNVTEDLALKIVDLRKENERLRKALSGDDSTLAKWNELWENAILNFSDKDSNRALCFFHGMVKTYLMCRTLNAERIVDAMERAIDYAKERR